MGSSGEGRLSPRMVEFVALMRQMFPSDVVALVLGEARYQAHLRGGRQVTRRDWDAAQQVLAESDDSSEWQTQLADTRRERSGGDGQW